MQVDPSIIKKIDQCVMCGLCLPHCPTYAVNQTESESPRGRISLVKAYMQGQLTHGNALEQHLQSCTGCFSCQRVCPAKVEYEEIIDAGRAAYRKHTSTSNKLMQSLALTTLTTTWGQSLLLKASVLTRLSSRLKNSRAGVALSLAGRRNEISRVSPTSTTMIFSGCTGEIFDQTSIRSLAFLMRKLGTEPHIPESPLCCGALAQHAGLAKNAQKSRSQLAEYCAHHNIQQCVSFASGCGRELEKYGDQNTTVDAHTWLLQQPEFKNINIRPLAKKVLLHVPCSMTAQTTQHMKKVLSLIPEMELLEFNDNINCCGAGGMQLLTANKTSDALANKKAARTIQLLPDIIVSANIGCALQLRHALQQQAKDIEVVHPITLLARQI